MLYVRVDPENRCAVMLMFQSKLLVIPFVKTGRYAQTYILFIIVSIISIIIISIIIIIIIVIIFIRDCFTALSVCVVCCMLEEALDLCVCVCIYVCVCVYE